MVQTLIVLRTHAHLQVLDSTTYTWHLGPPLPSATWGHCLVTAHTNQLVLVGGWKDSGHHNVLGGLAETHLLLGRRSEGRRWSRMPDMRQGRATHGCVAERYKVIWSIKDAGPA